MLGAIEDLSDGPVVHTLGPHNSTPPTSFHLILLVPSFPNPQSPLPKHTCLGTIDFVIDHVARKGIMSVLDVSVQERRRRDSGWAGRDCFLACPTDDSGLTCSGRGVCSHGTHGDGT